MKEIRLFKIVFALAGIVSVFLLTVTLTQAQSRPRKVKDKPTNSNSNTSTPQPKEEPLLDVVPTNNNSNTSPSKTTGNTNTSNTSTNTTRPRNQTTNTNTTGNTASSSTTVTTPKVSSTADTTAAYNLFQQKQYDAALKEAKRVIALDPNNTEAWKIAGFSEYNLKQYKEAANDLQKALELLRAAKEKDDENIINALAQSYARSEQYAKALPLLTEITNKAGATPDAGLLYLRGLSEYKTGKPADAEKTFNQVVKLDAKNSSALYLLGQMAFERNDFTGAIALLQRTTQADPKNAAAWQRLAIAYMQRAAISAEEDEAKAKADYQGAISAAEGLTKALPGDDSTALLGQVLGTTGNYQRAITELEKVTVGTKGKYESLYWLGVSYSRLKMFPKAITAFERAAQKNPNDANTYRELGYAHENLKQYAKAIEAYERGAKAAPDDTFFPERINQLKPFAKKP